MTRRGLCSPFLLTILIAAIPANAATLVTPIAPANNGDFIDCTVTNVGTKPITPAAQLVGLTGLPVTPATNDCTIPVAAGATCQVTAAPNVSAYCVVKASGKVRAAISVFDAGNKLLSVIPATK